MKYVFRLSIIALISLSSCKRELSPNDFLKWVNTDNGLQQLNTGVDFKFEASMRPSEFIFLLNNKSNAFSKEHLEKSIERLNETVHIQFRIYDSQGEINALKKNLINDREFYARLSHLSEGIRHDFKVISGNDTLKCSMHHFERTYGIQPFVNVLLAFDCKKDFKENGFKLVYNDQIFDGEQRVFEFQASDIKNIPTLKIQP